MSARAGHGGARFSRGPAAAGLVPMALVVSAGAGLATGIVAFFVLEKLPFAAQNGTTREPHV